MVYRGEQITKILSKGYDGIFGDIEQPDLWWVNSTAGIPINPRTGEEYVARAYG